jgi:hypothetical protein
MAITNAYKVITVSNIKRERFNLSFSIELLRTLRQIAHDRSMAGKYTGVNELLEDAADQWLTAQADVPKTEQNIDGQTPKKVLKYTSNKQQDPLHETLDRLLATDQRDHIKAVLTYAQSWLDSHEKKVEAAASTEKSFSLTAELQEGRELSKGYIDETIIRAEATGNPRVPGDPGAHDRDEPPLRPGHKKAGSGHRKQAG